MNERTLSIAVGRDRGGLHEKFIEAIEEKKTSYPGLQYSLVNLERSDWIEQIGESSLVIWKPPYMGHEFSGYFKEKVFFLENYLGKIVVPNYASIWHFESKAAQSYLFSYAGVPTPRTILSFDFDESLELAEKESFPFVLKRSAGAASSSVRAVNSLSEFRRFLRKEFSNTLWENTMYCGSKLKRVLCSIRHGWFWDLVARRIKGTTIFGIVYWQEFIHNNSADLRITAIGDRFATGFWRNNRPGDFRASGSGLIDYDRPIPESAIRYCLSLNRLLGFDTMAYDILYKDGKMLISEMSYGYYAKAVQRVSGYSLLETDGTLRFIEGNTWPQKLWVEWALLKAFQAL